MSMDEVTALEAEIMGALPAADARADATRNGGDMVILAYAHDVLCNSWNGPGTRLDRLRKIAAELRRIA